MVIIYRHLNHWRNTHKWQKNKHYSTKHYRENWNINQLNHSTNGQLSLIRLIGERYRFCQTYWLRKLRADITIWPMKSPATCRCLEASVVWGLWSDIINHNHPATKAFRTIKIIWNRNERFSTLLYTYVFELCNHWSYFGLDFS
jgi:hypothetical protein